MRVHEKNMQFLPPGFDFVTEERLDPDEPVIDTGIYFEPGVVTHLNGRKYVSLNSVKLYAQILGYKLCPIEGCTEECGCNPLDTKLTKPGKTAS